MDGWTRMVKEKQWPGFPPLGDVLAQVFQIHVHSVHLRFDFSQCIFGAEVRSDRYYAFIITSLRGLEDYFG